jgi:hypothetical protein
MRKSAPAAPDPYATAAAQRDANLEAARTNASLNRNDTFSPQGSVRNVDMGNDRWATYIEPSADQQRLYQQGVDLDMRTGQLALDAIPRAGRILGSDIDTSSLPAWAMDDPDARNRATAGIMSRLEPQFQRDRQSLEGRLLSQGFQPGTEAYRRAADELNRTVTDARLQADAAGMAESRAAAGFTNQNRAAQLAEMLQLRAQPINEISALFGLGPGMQMPQAMQQPGVQTQPADVAGNIYANFQQRSQNFNANNAAVAGLAGAGLGALGGWAGRANWFGSTPRT